MIIMPRKKSSKFQKTKRVKKPARAQVKKTAALQKLSLAAPPPVSRAPEVLQPARGMRDILPQEENFWKIVTSRASEISSAFGYGYIETPILEHKSLFVRGVGGVTDIVQKEMYSFKDQGGDELCLRPEGTAAVARAYINHGMLNLPQPVKLWYLGPFFRRERPQAGRYRQFHQWSVEVLGDEHPVLDAEVISLAVAFFRDLEIPVTLEMNSIGCEECRSAYKQELVKFYTPKRELLCEACKARLQTNPMRLLDCKEPQCELLKEGAPQTTDNLCEKCRDHFIKVLEYLDELAIPYNLNTHIVRGLDYYNRTVFEILPAKVVPVKEVKDGSDVKEVQEGQVGTEEKTEVTEEKEEKLSAQSALGGGGRYDGLVAQLGGRPTPAVGFSVGLERTVNMVRALKRQGLNAQVPRVFIAQLGEAARRKTLALWHILRKDVPVAASLSKDGLKAQLEIANRLGVRFAVIIGQKEILDDTAIIRDMEAGIQEVVDYNRLPHEIKKKLGE